MALTALGRALTSQFRVAQLGVRSKMLGSLLKLWPLLDVRRLDATAPEWLRLSTLTIAEHRRESARLAARYYEQLRAVELPDVEPYRARLLDSVPETEADEAIRTSLIVTGPVAIKKATQRITNLAEVDSPAASERALATVHETALTQVEGAAVRHVLNGGRDLLREEGARDVRALAFARVSDGDPCYFCALMISRGFVYRTKKAAGRNANDRFDGPGLYKFHDRCACTVAPVFDRDTPASEQEAKFKALYEKARKNAAQSREPVMEEFRWLVEGHRPANRRAVGPKSAEATQSDRRRTVELQIAALEPTFTSLSKRLAAGEPVRKPYEYQERLLTQLRDELASL